MSKWKNKEGTIWNKDHNLGCESQNRCIWSCLLKVMRDSDREKRKEWRTQMEGEQKSDTWSKAWRSSLAWL